MAGVADVVVVGGGIVGLATAMQVIRARPGAEVVVLEKSTGVAHEQTGHNSGVVHAGVYYTPGSLKARLCKAGARATIEFAAQHGVPWRRPGKMIVATQAEQLPRLSALATRSTANGLEYERLSASQLHEREPRIRGLAALWFPATAITDYPAISRAMADEIGAAGGTVVTGVQVDTIAETSASVRIGAGERSWTARRAVFCTGAQADRTAALAGLRPDFTIMPFRGEYFRLAPGRDDVCRALIYPVPDPELPFLGVHLTPMIGGFVTVGPNAVLGLAREGYPKGSVDGRDLAAMARFPGSYRVAAAQWRTGLVEMRNSLFRKGYLRLCQQYCPELRVEDLRPHVAGIRAQAVRRDGSFVEDFHFLATDRTLHVANAPSPAATSAIPIGQMVAERLFAG